MPEQIIQTNPASKKQPKPDKRMVIPGLVAALLGGHIVFIMVAITVATGDRSFAVVPDYYQKAVDFDDRKAALAVSRALGWRYELQLSDSVNGMQERQAIIRLSDADGTPITGAAVSLSCYHYARAGDPMTLELIELLPGQYAGAARMGREGFWQFELSASNAKDVFVGEFKQFVRKPGGAG